MTDISDSEIWEIKYRDAEVPKLIVTLETSMGENIVSRILTTVIGAHSTL